MAKKKSYSEDFKLEALEKWQSSGKSAAVIETELDISQGSLSRWKRALGVEFDAGESPEQDDEQAQEPDTAAGTSESAPDEEIEESEPAASDSLEVTEKDQEPIQVEEAPPTGPDSVNVAPKSEDTATTASEVASSPEGPSIAKRIAGIAAVIFGVLGVALSIAAVIAVWVVNTPLTDRSVELLVTVEGALEVVETSLVRADDTLQTVRDGINTAAAQIPTSELLAVVGNIKAIVDGANSTAETASSVLGIANSIPFLGSSKTQEQDQGTNLDELSLTLDQISTGLTRVEELLNSLAAGGAPGGLIDNINQDIDALQMTLNEAENNAIDAGTVVAEVRVNIPRWIDIASIIISLLLIWLGAAQYSLFVHGLGWSRGV